METLALDPFYTPASETNEIVVDANFLGRRNAALTMSWLQPWCDQIGFPRDVESGFPRMTTDLLLHAGAATAILSWELMGFDKTIGQHVASAAETFSRFAHRMTSGDASQYVGNEGESLFKEVVRFEGVYRIPMTSGQLDPHSAFVMNPATVETEAIELLAKLLLDFRDVPTK